jgi:AI-2E family transporter
MGVISFVLNYIPYVGPLVAVILPVIFATAQFESWQMAAIIFGSLYLIQFVIGNYLEPSCHLTLRDAVRIFDMGFSMGHAWGFYRPSRNNRAFHDLGTESVDALDS